MRLVRRIIIIVCSILLIPLISSSMFGVLHGKYYSKYLQDKIKNGSAKAIEVNKQVKIDNDTICIQRIIKSGNDIYVRVSVRKKNGWSFPWSAIKLYDNLGNSDFSGSMESSGQPWGEEALMRYNNINSNCKKITLKLEWYDRKMEVEVPLDGGSKL